MHNTFARGLLALALAALFAQLSACSSALPEPVGDPVWINGAPEAKP